MSDQDIIFTTGKTIRPNLGIVGICPNGTLSEGYDSGIIVLDDDSEEWEYESGLNNQECVELANLMILRWKAFGEKHNNLCRGE